MSERELVVQAPAKLNLFLKVLAKRADGYHEIDTVMQAIDLQDTLYFRLLDHPEIRLTMQQTLQRAGGGEEPRDEIPVDESNLIVRAARQLQQFSGTFQGAEIVLVKRIPSQAGLGGGSADAGATLQGLNHLWNLRLPAQTLADLAAPLGSDIPFFAAGARLAQCVGRGEQLQTESGQLLHFVIAKPRAGLSTAKVYSNCAVSTFAQSGKDVLNALRNGSLSELKFNMKNGLEESARHLSPAVHQLLTIMQGQPFVCSLLSGSGSACFGVCHSRKQALHLAGRLRGMIAGDVFVARSRV